MKQEQIDNVNRNKPNKGKITQKKSRKSGKLEKNGKKNELHKHNYSISDSTQCEEHADVVKIKENCRTFSNLQFSQSLWEKLQSSENLIFVHV